LIGKDNFANSLKKYFKKFAFKNTTLADFISILDEDFSKQNFDFNLNTWKE